jgi:hypothetical protein
MAIRQVIDNLAVRRDPFSVATRWPSSHPKADDRSWRRSSAGRFLAALVGVPASLLDARGRSLRSVLLFGVLGALGSAAVEKSGTTGTAEEEGVIVIQSFERGVSAAHSANPDVKLRVDRDATLSGEWILSVDYPAPTGNPAGRDVWCDADNPDWTSGRAIAFQAKSEHPMRLSMSFLDRNRVAYTTWIDLAGDAWQSVRVSFDAIRPNPFFQPPGANKDAPIDVSEVTRIGFGTQDPNAGRFAISRLVVVD